MYRYFSTAIIVIFLMVGSASAEFVPRAFWTSPTVTYILNENSMAELCVDVWGREYNIFDNPVAMCVLPAGSGSNTEYFFIIDEVRGLLTHIGTIEDLVTGKREILYYKTYGNGPGPGLHQFDRPRSTTISPRGPGTVRELYILVY